MFARSRVGESRQPKGVNAHHLKDLTPVNRLPERLRILHCGKERIFLGAYPKLERNEVRTGAKEDGEALERPPKAVIKTFPVEGAQLRTMERRKHLAEVDGDPRRNPVGNMRRRREPVEQVTISLARGPACGVACRWCTSAQTRHIRPHLLVVTLGAPFLGVYHAPLPKHLTGKRAPQAADGRCCGKGAVVLIAAKTAGGPNEAAEDLGNAKGMKGAACALVGRLCGADGGCGNDKESGVQKWGVAKESGQRRR
ncbi:hypothetical protein BDK51DRAFT_43156 [Blyttiomyces helicus]|uniref:Uncharacterized protein n=1 Tax=Blyttiomyces helicus TaxID=388810 RepID=A0A4P9W8Z6_9FUNG|nr:hypothetical protein BDK51DRAFT_43156 [Blyttiomyces helicus]|eukprot:RKO87955.1 hypothetical protein BDK51DRAFT_43156 [Blyttiomyces helicus]